MIDNVHALTILAATPQLGAAKIFDLIAYCGSAADALQLEVDELALLRGFGPKTCSSWGWWRRSECWKRNLDAAADVAIIPYYSPHYPSLLHTLDNPPVVLYVRGQLPVCHHVAVVGSRMVEGDALARARVVGRDLGRSGFAVVSGLAQGVDTYAHFGALEGGGVTLALLGAGLDYPSDNPALASAIAAHGALISTYPMSAAPQRHTFLQRNRILIALSRAAFLVEAVASGGAVQAMEYALLLQRPAYAFPGSAGGDALIAKGAVAISSPRQLVEALLSHRRGEMPLPSKKRAIYQPSLPWMQEAVAQRTANRYNGAVPKE